jgi:hypothetical protein
MNDQGVKIVDSFICAEKVITRHAFAATPYFKTSGVDPRISDFSGSTTIYTIHVNILTLPWDKV